MTRLKVAILFSSRTLQKSGLLSGIMCQARAIRTFICLNIFHQCSCAECISHTHFRNNNNAVPPPTLNLPSPTTPLIFATHSVTQSFSVPTSSGCAARHRVTILAVPNCRSKSSTEISSLPPKKSSPSLSTPSRSHVLRTKGEEGKEVTGG